MRTTLFNFIFLITFSTTYGQNAFTVQKGEIDRTGSFSFMVEQLPVKYQNIWSKSDFNIYKNIHYSNRVSKKYIDKENLFTWKVFVHDTYTKDIPAGILLLSTNFTYIDFPQSFKDLCKENNLILIAPDLSINDLYSVELSLAALDITKFRYKIDHNRIFYVAFGNQIKHEAHLHSPNHFTGILGIRSQIGWDEKELQKSLGKSSYNELIDGLKKTSFYLLESTPEKMFSSLDNTYTFTYFHPTLLYNKIIYESGLFKNKKSENFRTDKFNGLSIKVTNKNEDLFLELKLRVLSEAFQFLDSKSLKLKEQYFEDGVKFEQNEQYADAFKSFQNAYKLSHPKAKIRIDDILKEVKKIEFSAIKNFTQKNYYEAYITASSLSKSYPLEYVEDSRVILDKIKKDKNIVTEIKAAIYLKKAETSFSKKLSTKNSLLSACNKVIEICPNTKTAKKAHKMLEEIR